jgi:hypothetical protein
MRLVNARDNAPVVFYAHYKGHGTIENNGSNRSRFVIRLCGERHDYRDGVWNNDRFRFLAVVL